MIEMIKGRFFWVYMLIIISVVGLFSFVQIGPKNNIKLHQVPIALVNADTTGNESDQLENQLKNQFESNHAQIKWIKVNKTGELKQGFANKHYYAAVIIKQDFSRNLEMQSKYLKQSIMKQQVSTTNLPTDSQKFVTPKQGKIEIRINEGMNVAMAQALEQVLPKIGNAISTQLKNKITRVMMVNNLTVPVNINQILLHPVKTTTVKVNKIPSKSVSGMAPMLITVLIWFGSLLSSILLWREHQKLSLSNRHSVRLVNSQVVSGFVMSLVVGISIFFFAHTCFGIPVPDHAELIEILVLSVFVFYLLQTLVLNIAGFRGWPLIIIVWLLATGVLSYAPQMLPALYRHWIYSWIPMRFAMEMVTNTLYFQSGSLTMGQSLSVILIIGAVSLIAMYLIALIKHLRAKE